MLQDLTLDSMSEIRKQLRQIQSEVKKINKENELELLQQKYGGSLHKNDTILKVNRFCSIEQLGDCFKLTSIVYGTKREFYGDIKKMESLLENV